MNALLSTLQINMTAMLYSQSGDRVDLVLSIEGHDKEICSNSAKLQWCYSYY